MAAIHDKMKATLEATGLPYKQVECYGSQIVVTAWCQESANRWASLLARFAKVRGQTQGLDEKKDGNPTGMLRDKYVTVYRVFAVIA
jgi:hypothetical protein